MRALCLALLFGGCAAIEPALVRLPALGVPCAIRLDPTPSISGYWSRDTLGPELARALSSEMSATLAQAGFTVGDDLELRIAADLGGSRKHLHATTTVEVLREGRVVDRLVVETHGEAARYPEQAAIRAVNALGASPALRRETTQKLGPPILAMFDLGSTQLDEVARDQLSEYLFVRLTQSQRYKLLPRQTLRDQLIEEKAGAFRACTDEACQIELGKALAAQKTLSSALIRVGDSCALTATIYDLRTESAEIAASVKTACGHEALLSAADALIKDLVTRAR